METWLQENPPHVAHTCTRTPRSCWGILKLRATTLAPRYIFESATKCVCGWDVAMRDIRRSAIVWKCPGTPRESKELIRATCWDEKRQQQEVHVCTWPAGFYQFCFLSPPLPHPCGPSPTARATSIVQKVLQRVFWELVCPGSDSWGCFFLLWDFPFAEVLMESRRCLQLDVVWTETVRVQQTGTQKLQQD